MFDTMRRSCRQSSEPWSVGTFKESRRQDRGMPSLRDLLGLLYDERPELPDPPPWLPSRACLRARHAHPWGGHVPFLAGVAILTNKAYR
jgi:hypothetical protein